ncbi:V-type ATP synthase subunit I [Nanoarchaeota archaeon]
MLRAKRMTKVGVVGPKSEQEKLIEKLHELNVMHIEQHKADEELDIGKPLGKAAELSEVLVKLRSAASHLDVTEPTSRHVIKKLKKKKLDLKQVNKNTHKIYSEILTIINKKNELQEKRNVLADLREELNLLVHLNLPPEAIEQSESLAAFIGYTEKEILNLKGKIEQITKTFELRQRKNEKNYVAVFVSKEDEEKVKTLLNEIKFIPIEFKKLGNIRGMPSDQISQINKQTLLLEKYDKECSKELDKIKTDWAEFVSAHIALIEEDLEKAEAPLKFGATEEAFFITGWVPKKRFEKVKDELIISTDEHLYVEEVSIEKTDSVPIELQHSALVRPFQFFMDLYSLPSYKEIDPTVLMFFTFPLFFGIMLGDVGYGIVTLLLWVFLKRKIPSARALLNIMIFASIFSIIFGGVYGEYFGFETVSEGTGEWMCSNTGICLQKVLNGHGNGNGNAEAEHNGAAEHNGEAEYSTLEEHETEVVTQTYSSMEQEIIDEESEDDNVADYEDYELKNTEEVAEEVYEDSEYVDLEYVDSEDSEEAEESEYYEDHEEETITQVASTYETEQGAETEELEEGEEGEDHATSAAAATTSASASHEDNNGGNNGHSEVVYTFPRLLNRLHGELDLGGVRLPVILAIGAFIGFLHLNLALVLGFINELGHGLWKAFCAKISWMVLQAGVVLLALGYTGQGIPVFVGWIVLVISMVLLYLGEGVNGLVEMPAIFSNMLSYMRLGAVGLASVGLAVVVNENFGIPFIQKGGIFIFVGLLLMFLGHAVNIALGVIGPFLHSLRLHYVEFFTKFFRGGGKRYEPFGQNGEGN